MSETRGVSCAPVEGVGEVAPGDDLVALLAHGADLADGDIVLVTSKVVSKAEGRVVLGEKDDALAAETVRVVARRGPTSIVRTRHGLVMAGAGIDASNTPPGHLLLLPVDPDLSARTLREGIRSRLGRNVAVLVTDTAGRAWRQGQTDIAIGAAGMEVLEDHAGRVDPYGNELAVTAPAVADELAGLGDLVKGKLSGRPFAVVRGLATRVLAADDHGPGAAALLRPPATDMFGYGAREAVQAALVRDEPGDGFGGPAGAAEVAHAVAGAASAGGCRASTTVAGEAVELHLQAEASPDTAEAWRGLGRAEGAAEAAAYAHGWRVDHERTSGLEVRLRLVPSTPYTSGDPSTERKR